MMKKCTLLWREARFEVKMCKAHHARSTFGSWDVEKVHGVVARRTFESRNAKNTLCLEHFLRLGCAFVCRMTWPHLFRGRRSTLETWDGKIAKHIGTRPSACHSAFHFWRKFPRITSFLMLSVNLENWGSIVDLLCFWRCQVPKLRKSRRLASFLMLSTSKVSQNSFVFKLAGAQIGR